MGGNPAPQNLAFPSASEPNPIAKGLRGTGPMTILDQTVPPPTSTQGPNQGPTNQPAGPTGPNGPVGTPYYYYDVGNMVAPLSQYPTGNYQGAYGANSMYFPSGTNIPQGYSLVSYFDPTTNQSYGPNNPNNQYGGIYQYNPQNFQYGQPFTNDLSKINSNNTVLGSNVLTPQAGPAALPFYLPQQGSNDPFAGFYTGAAFK